MQFFTIWFYQTMSFTKCSVSWEVNMLLCNKGNEFNKIIGMPPDHTTACERLKLWNWLREWYYDAPLLQWHVIYALEHKITICSWRYSMLSCVVRNYIKLKHPEIVLSCFNNWCLTELKMHNNNFIKRSLFALVTLSLYKFRWIHSETRQCIWEWSRVRGLLPSAASGS